MILVEFEGLAAPVAFHDGTERLLGLVDRIIASWPRRTLADTTGGAQPEIVVSRVSGGVRIEAPWLDAPVVEGTDFRVAGNLVVDLVEGFLANHPAMPALHCGAALFAGRLVIFPGSARAGKSTLAARLAADGVPVFADDVLPLLGEDEAAAGARALSFGIAPRLRLPLPAGAGPILRDALACSDGPADDAYAYLTVPGRPRFGDAAPLGAVVLLDRVAEGSCELMPASPGDGLEALILRNMAGALPASVTVARLHAIIARLPCLRLRYAGVDEAAELLSRHFADADAFRPTSPPSRASSPRMPTPPGRTRLPDRAPDHRWCQHTAAVLHDLEDGAFLVHGETDEVLRLDRLTRGVWSLLAEPTSETEVTTLLAEAFPDIPRPRIAADMATFFADLAARDLIRRSN